MNIVKGQGLPDFVMCEKGPSAFLENLALRFKQKQIYTYIGEQIVAMNPFTKLDIYGAGKMKEYVNRHMYEVQPHIYALAEDTFRQLTQDLRNQCVLITGESGAGKTEASKIFLNYIVMVSGTQSHGRGVPGGAETVKERLVASNPVLEAFGNAKTLRNDNSSRFGKYMEIQFDGGGAPLGGCVHKYLLEKSRVVTRAKDERNFHVFYQLLSDSSLRNKLGLTKQGDYTLLANSGCFSVRSINDSKDFAEVVQAMDELGFEERDKESAWKILGAILVLGNIAFEVHNDVAKVKNSSLDDLAAAAGLLGMSPDELTKALCTRDIQTSGVTTVVPLSEEQSVFARDSMCKALYSHLFAFVVDTINKSLQGDREADVCIGVLDIYGFEIFENNSFEQFCINYCNEKLQQVFIDLVLKQEQEEYKREGIEWSPIPYFNNQPIIDLIEKNTGILRLLDETCMVGEATPKALLDKLDRSFGSTNKFYDSFATTNDKAISRTGFVVTHYAGKVQYDVTEFIYKNRDTLNGTIKDACNSSQDTLVQSFFPKIRSNKRPTTAGNHFKKNVNALISKLLTCQPHYIRCIKPNDRRLAFTLDKERVDHQVSYLNLVETVRVRRAGFCNRQPYDRFLPRYKMVCGATWPHWSGQPKEGCAKIIESLGVPASEYRLGKSKIFIKSASTLTKLEEVRQEKLHHVAVALQRQWRVLRVDSKVHKTFGGKKPFVFLGPKSFKGDYVSCEGGKVEAKLQTAIKRLFAENGDRDVKFIAHVGKINKRAAIQDRILMVTDRHIYNLKPSNFESQWKVPLSLHQIQGLFMSPHEDSILVIKNEAPNKDLVLDMAFGCEVGTGEGGVNRLVELVYELSLLTSLINGSPVEVFFQDSISFNNVSKSSTTTAEKTLEFTKQTKPNKRTLAVKSSSKSLNVLIPLSTVPCKTTNCEQHAFTLNLCTDCIGDAAGRSAKGHRRQLSSESEILNAFAVFDKDGNGMANAGELRHVLTNLGERLSDEEVSEMLHEGDPHGTGAIDYRAFVDIMASYASK